MNVQIDIFKLCFLALIAAAGLIYIFISIVRKLRRKVRHKRYKKLLAKDSDFKQLVRHRDLYMKAYTDKDKVERSLTEQIDELLDPTYFVYLPEAERIAREAKAEEIRKLWWHNHREILRLTEKCNEADEAFVTYCDEHKVDAK